MIDEREAQAALRAHLEGSIAVKQRAVTACGPAVVAAATLVADCLSHRGRLLLCGNGGSAADCQHIAAEFVSVLDQRNPRPALSAIALTTDTSFLTASANDFGFDGVFSRQVEALGQPGDVLVGITTSGRSRNVLRALARARELGLRTIVLTGGSGGEAAALADVAIVVPSESTQHIQETHIAVGHILCALVERALFANAGATA